MSGKGCWGAGPPRRLATRQGGELAPSGPGGSPPPGLGAPAGAQSPPSVRCAGAVATADPLRAPGGGRGAGGGVRPGANFPARVPAPRGALNASGTRCPRGGALGTWVEKAPKALLAGGRAEPGRAGVSVTSPGPRAEPLCAPPRRSRAGGRGRRGGESHDPSDFANRAQPVDGKVRAAAAGGGQILTFSARRPEGERGGQKQERPQRGQGPSSEGRLHPCGLGQNSPLSAIKKRGGEGEGKSPAQSSPLFQRRGRRKQGSRGGAHGAGGAGDAQRRPRAGRTGEPGAHRGGRSAAKASIFKAERERQEGGGQLHREGAKPKSVPAMATQTRPRPQGAAGGRAAVRKLCPKCRARARPRCGGRNE